MKILFLFLAAILTTRFSQAQQTILAEYPSKELAKTVGVITPADPAVLKLENAGSSPYHVTLLTIDSPKITTKTYAISGEVSYEKIEGDGYLEMWNHFGAAAYFSRTLGVSGLLKKLNGTSSWRPFTLPFQADTPSPTKLVINLHLPGSGTVFLRNLRLIQSDSFDALLQAPGAWWSDRSAGSIGNISGLLIGLLGGLVQWFGNRGKAPRFVFITIKGLIALSGVALTVGLMALLQHQPFAVWFPPLLIGVVTGTMFPIWLWKYKRQFQEAELRRIASLDAVG